MVIEYGTILYEGYNNQLKMPYDTPFNGMSIRKSFSEACESFPRLKSLGRGPLLIRTAKRKNNYVTQLLADKTISSYSSAEAIQLRDLCIRQCMVVPTLRRVFSSIRVIIDRDPLKDVLKE